MSKAKETLEDVIYDVNEYVENVINLIKEGERISAIEDLQDLLLIVNDINLDKL